MADAVGLLLLAVLCTTTTSRHLLFFLALLRRASASLTLQRQDEGEQYYKVCVCVCVCVIVGQFRNVLFKATAANESRQELVNSFNPSDRRVSFRLVPRLASRKLDCLQVVLFGLDFLRCVRVHAWLVACEQSYPALGERQIPALPANLRHIMKEEHVIQGICTP